MNNDKRLKEKRKLLRKEFTDAEKLLWSKLRGKQLNGIKFYRQFSVGSYILDFYSHKHRLAIELDGGHHSETRVETNDKRRTQYLEAQGIKVLRFWNNDLFNNLLGILETISNYVK